MQRNTFYFSNDDRKTKGRLDKRLKKYCNNKRNKKKFKTKLYVPIIINYTYDYINTFKRKKNFIKNSENFNLPPVKNRADSTHYSVHLSRKSYDCFSFYFIFFVCLFSLFTICVYAWYLFLSFYFL